jgi:hypothetical protein
VVYPCGEERDAFQQACDVWIVHSVGRQAEATGDLRMSVGEFGSEALDGVQFAFVIGQQGVRHRFDREKGRVHTETTKDHGAALSQ